MTLNAYRLAQPSNTAGLIFFDGDGTNDSRLASGAQLATSTQP